MSRLEFPHKTNEALRKEFDVILADSARVIPAGVELLKTLQGLPTRDLKAELAIATGVNTLLGRSRFSVRTGIEAYKAEGVIMGSYADNWPKLAEKGKPYVEFVHSVEETDVDLQYVHSLDGFVRGDQIGSKTALGNDWYLMLGLNKVHLIPVTGFKSAKIAPYDFGF